MEKPVSIKVQELKEELVDLINDSGLPAFIVEPIVKDIYEQIIQAKNQEYTKDKENYENSLKEEKKDAKN
jgi:hypothetical protein